jgi:NAD(P)H-flavin reductase
LIGVLQEFNWTALQNQNKKMPPTGGLVSARQIYQMKLTSVRDLTHNVREVIVEAQDPAQFNFKAGQFVMLHVPQAEGKPALRAYSIASDERISNGFVLLFKYVENGVASKFVWSLKGGETLQFTGPFGKVLFQEPPTKQIVFVNTGTGLSQHLSYLVSKSETHPDLQYRLLFGVRSQKDIYYEDTLKNLSKKISNFKYEYILSRPETGWTGRQGYVQNFIREFEYNGENTTFYLCGNGGMIKETKAILEADRFPKNRIWAEAFD